MLKLFEDNTEIIIDKRKIVTYQNEKLLKIDTLPHLRATILPILGIYDLLGKYKNFKKYNSTDLPAEYLSSIHSSS